jgi:hypothetical protein
MMKWGLIPHWAKDDKLQYSTFNARAEDFMNKPFRDAWRWGQRCLVVTDGFYEWKKLDPKGQGEAALCDRHGRRRPNGYGRSLGKMEIAEGRGNSELHGHNLRAQSVSRRTAQPHAGHPPRSRVA